MGMWTQMMREQTLLEKILMGVILVCVIIGLVMAIFFWHENEKAQTELREIENKRWME